MKRTVSVLAGAILLAHLVSLFVLPAASSRILVAELARYAILALTIWTLADAYRRTAGFARLVVLLILAGILPSLIRITFQSFFDLREISGPLYLFLLVLHVVPATAIVLVPERVTRYRELQPYALDIVQLGIALASFYFLFYFPLHAAGATTPSLTLLIEIRNFVLIAALGGRVLLSRKPSARDIQSRLLIILVVQQFDILLQQAAGRQMGVFTGSWMDVAATLEVIAFPLVFARIPSSQDRFVRTTGRPLSFSFGMHFIPAVLPALVWLIAITATYEDRNLALVLAGTSALCYGLRWYVVQKQAAADALQLWISERQLRELAAAFSQRDRDAFFHSITVMLCKTLGVKYALIGEPLAGSQGKAMQTLAMAENGTPIPNFTYELLNSPSARVMAEGFCYFEQSVAEQFPLDSALAKARAQSYMGQRLHGASGEVLGLLIIVHDQPLRDAKVARDILQICSTPVGIELERSHAEEQLRSSEQKFALAFKQSPSLMTISDAETETFIDVNDIFAAAYGAPREEIIGRTSLELNSWASLEERKQALDQLRNTGRVRNLEFSGRARNGQARQFQASADILDFRGRKLILSTMRDITVERAAQKALEESERKYRDLFQNANDFLFTLDCDGRFLSLNRKGEELSGISGDKATAYRLEEIIAESSRSRLRENMARVLAGEGSDIFEVTLAEQEGRMAPVLEVALRLVSEQGRPVAVQGIARDVSDRRSLEKKFLQVQKLQAVGTLAGGIAHDFNNLLTVITGYVHLVLAQMQDEDPAREDVEEIQKAAERAASLTRQLLTFSRQQVTRRVALDLNESVRGMEKMLQSLLGANIQIVSDLQAGLPRVLADATQVDQVLLNLALNARDAMPQGGKLEFRTGQENLRWRDSNLDLPAGSYVTLSVIDNGTGMDDGTQSRIFEPFFTTKDVGKGTGLGLSTVYGIVQQCGGHIGVKSAVGWGTTFTIHFPAITAAEEEQKATATAGPVRGTETILLVEDDSSIRNLAAKILETSGYRVLAAGDVESARGVLNDSSTAIDLVVTDLVIPGGDGVSLAQHAQAVRPGIKSFYISGNAAGKLPADAILLQKPFSPIELAARIRTILDEAR